MGRNSLLAFTEADVLAALDKAKGNQRAAAESLGMSQSWLARWLKEKGYVQRIEWVKEDKPA